ncbi:hypothetical protein GKC29_24985 [Micromonospora sp. WMMC415]|nr:hypothetical protein GKC29_24985 [Micromonospora sp. WMMC415]
MRRVVCLELRMARHPQLGDSHRSIPALITLQNECPLRERLTVMLMTARYQVDQERADVSPDGMRRLLRWADWDVDAVRDDVRGYVVEHVGDPGGVLIVDDIEFLKRGTQSAGVVRWGVDEVPAGAGPFPTPSSRTGRARFRASGSPVTTA